MSNLHCGRGYPGVALLFGLGCHYFGPNSQKNSTGLERIHICAQILTKLVFIWAFCSTGDLGNVFFYLLCDQPLVFIMSGSGLVYIFCLLRLIYICTIGLRPF